MLAAPASPVTDEDRLLDPVVAWPDSPAGAAPATTGLTYWTDPVSGSASVFWTALLGFGSVW